MKDGFREHQTLEKVLVVQLPRHLEFLQMLVLLEEHGKFTLASRRPSERPSGQSTDQREQEAADGACSLTEGAVLLQEHGDELVGQSRRYGHRWARHLGTCGQVLEQAHPHFQDVLTRLLLQPLVQLERVLLTEPVRGGEERGWDEGDLQKKRLLMFLPGLLSRSVQASGL